MEEQPVQRHRPSENAARSEIGVQIMSEREMEPGRDIQGQNQKSV